jgi:RNA polymerase primary sigma factor
VDGIQTYFKTIRANKILTKAEEQALGRKKAIWAEHIKYKLHPAFDNKPRIATEAELHASKQAFDKLWVHNLRLVVSIAKHYTKNGALLEDVIGYGNEGLHRAICKWDPEKGYKFSTYATWWIKQFIIRSINQTKREIRLPVHQEEAIGRLRKAINQAEQNREEISDEELVARANTTLNLLKIYRENTSNIVSLNEYVKGYDEETERGDLIEDTETSVEEEVFTKEREKIVEEILSSFSLKERALLVLRNGYYGEEPRTLDETGLKLGWPREYVRETEHKLNERLLELLKERLGNE